MLRISRARDERGITLVLVALSMVVMMIFIAYAVDLGNARQFRRQAQNGADAAALAAAQDLTDLTITPASRMANAETTAKSYITKTYGTPSTTWASCTDSGALAVQGTTPCISFDSATSPQRVRVRIPQDAIKTSFGQFAGVNNIRVGAAATAGIGSPLNGRILPLVIDGGSGNICVENAGNNQGCSNRKQGNFGDMQSPRLVSFTGGSNSDRLTINYAMGIDHALINYVSGTKICDGDQNSPCTASNTTGTPTSPPYANHVNTATGNSTNEPTAGLVTGFSANGSTFCGRLQRPVYTDTNVTDPIPGNCATPASPTSTLTLSGTTYTLSSRHIAYYFTDTNTLKNFYGSQADTRVPPATTPSTSNLWGSNLPGNGNVSGDDTLTCFMSKYQPATTTTAAIIPTNGSGSGNTCKGLGGGTQTVPIFSHDIVNDPRFGYIPVVSSMPNGGSTASPVTKFVAAFIYNLYTTNTKLQALDAWVFDPSLITAGPYGVGTQFNYIGGAATISLTS